jgi:thymidylate synthase (FAD)
MEKMLMIDKIDVLNGGFVRLVDHMGNDLSIVRSARVSYNADWRESVDQGASDEKLIKYLWKNKHTSPFEAVSFTFEVKAPIFVFRQWHRHRTWSYNEISARYTELDEGYYVPEIEKITTQSSSNKQMRTNEVHPRAAAIRTIIACQCKTAFLEYKDLIEEGCPRELARSVLPVAAYSRMFATVDLHNLFHFLKLRLHEHSQYEIRVYAEAILKLITPIVPVAVTAFKESL